MEKILIVELTLKWSHETLDSFGYQISQVAKLKNSLTKGKKKALKWSTNLKEKGKRKREKQTNHMRLGLIPGEKESKPCGIL